MKASFIGDYDCLYKFAIILIVLQYQINKIKKLSMILWLLFLDQLNLTRHDSSSISLKYAALCSCAVSKVQMLATMTNRN